MLAAPQGEATIGLLVDGRRVRSAVLSERAPQAGWQRQSFDLGEWADGKEHTIALEYASTVGDDGSILVDDVTIRRATTTGR